MASEIRALSRQETANVEGRRVLVGDVTPIEVARRWATRSIGEKRVVDATATHLYARAEAKAARTAERAILDGDRAEALRQKQAQMLNHALYIEARRATDDAERAQRMMKRYGDADTLKGMDQGALDQIHALLERLDFGGASRREVERRQSLAAWVEGQRAQGLEPAVPDRLLDEAFRQHFSQMTMADLRGLSDVVQSIAHLGRLKQTLLDRKEAREFEALVKEAEDTAGRLPQREVSTRRNPGVGGTGFDRLAAKLGRAGSLLRMADASLLKMEQVFQWLDGDDPNGVFSRVDNYARPLLLSLDVLPRHLNQVIHDLAYREAIMDADRFLAAPRVRAAVEGALGREYYQQFRPWLQSIANDRTIDPRGLAFWDRVAHAARNNATMVGLGFRLSTMVVHGTSAALNSVGEAGMLPMAKAVGAFMRDPRGMRDFVFERSGEMRNRLNEVDRDMRDALRDLHGDHGPLATVRRFSMMGVAMLDMASALPT